MIARIWRALLAAASVRQWAMILAAPALTAVVAAIIYIVQRDGWSGAVEALRLTIMANVAYGALFLVGLVVVALTGTQVVANISKDGLKLNVRDDDDEPQALAVTGQVTVTPQAPKGDE